MALTNAQKVLLHRAKREARIEDEDYRAAIASVMQREDCRSSKDRRLTDEHLDRLMAWFEFYHWHGVDEERWEARTDSRAVFRRRGYWREKNRAGTTSRDRYNARGLQAECNRLEGLLQRAGKGADYCETIRRKTGGGWNYAAALRRTARAKEAR